MGFSLQEKVTAKEAAKRIEVLRREIDSAIPSDNPIFCSIRCRHQSAVGSRRIVNSIEPLGSSRHRSTSLM
jgi:hypothetical protein